MQDKVYVYPLFIEYDYEGRNLIGIFSTREKALEEKKKVENLNYFTGNFVIDQIEIDATYE